MNQIVPFSFQQSQIIQVLTPVVTNISLLTTEVPFDKLQNEINRFLDEKTNVFSPQKTGATLCGIIHGIYIHFNNIIGLPIQLKVLWDYVYLWITSNYNPFLIPYIMRRLNGIYCMISSHLKNSATNTGICSFKIVPTQEPAKIMSSKKEVLMLRAPYMITTILF